MPHRKDVSNEQITELYFRQGMNRRQTAEKLECSQDLIAYRLRQMGRVPKSMSDCVEAGKKRSIALSPEFLERLDGEMLGDGCVFVNKNSGSFRESFGHDKREWAEWLRDFLMCNGFDLVGTGIHYKKPCGKSPNSTWSFSTVFVMELGDFHRRWYVRNFLFDPAKTRCFSNRRYIKIVPTDLVLTPRALLHWYIGDGASSKQGGCCLHTEAFSYDEVEFLRFRLREDMGILSVRRRDNTIGLVRREWEKLLEIIGPSPVECYGYKWNKPLTSYGVSRGFNKEIDMVAVDRFLQETRIVSCEVS